MPRRPRLLFGVLQPDSTVAFLPLPHSPEGGVEGGGGGAPGTGGAPPAPAPPAAPPADTGFPPNTPLAQMNDGQRAAYWQHYARQHEDRAKELLAWQSANKQKVEGYDQLLTASQTEQERAIEAAKAAALDEGRRSGREEIVPQLVAAEFLAAAAGRLTRDQVTELLAPLDKKWFLTDAGAVDAAKVAGYVAQVAGVVAPGPAGGAGGAGAGLPKGFPDLGQGQRGGTKTTGKEAGLAEAEKRFGKPAAQRA